MSVRWAIALTAWLLAGATTLAHAQAPGRALRIQVPGNKAPTVIVGDKASVPTLDPASGKWVVPIDPDPPSFVTSYLISSDGSVVAIRLSIPNQILNANQVVYLGPPTVSGADELTVRTLWNANEIVRSPSDAQVQFAYLQDLLFINRKLKERYPAAPHVDVTSVRAAFMLFQVVANLAQNTWYVIDPDTQAIIDYARQTLVRADQRKTCTWLGPQACKGVSQLLASVKGLNAVRFRRMYDQLVPAGSKLSLQECQVGLAKDLRKFLDFVQEVNESGDDAQGISESRVAGDIATCETRIALCAAASPQDAIAQLESTLELLQPYAVPLRPRVAAITQARNDLRAGKPAVCPQ